MESLVDAEEQLLIETRWDHPASSSERKYWDWDVGGDASSVDVLCSEAAPAAADGDETRLARRKLAAACAVSLVFMAAEVAGGYAAHSLAVMTDAAHLLTDFGSIAISIFTLWVSSRPPTRTVTFGWYRAEILGVLFSVVSLWALTAALVLSAARRIVDGDYEINSEVMLLTSGFAVLANILMVLILHQSGASHGHGHGLPGGQRRTRKERHEHSHARGHGNASVKAAFIHVIGDLLQSVGVLMAAAIIHLWPQYKIADPICTFLFSVLVLGTTFHILKDVLGILMNGAPRGVAFDSVRELLLSVGGVVAVHNLHMWSLNAARSVLSAHVVTEEEANPGVVLARATTLLRSEFGFASITLQVENRGGPRDGAQERR